MTHVKSLIHRPRRLRQHDGLRRMVRETRLHPEEFVYPLFIVAGQDRKEPIASMPGQYRWSLDRLSEILEKIDRAGVLAVLLFGIPAKKDAMGSGAYAAEGIIQNAIVTLKRAHPELLVIGDVCLCEYSDHGHCGVLQDGEVQNDETLELLIKTAVSQAAAGVDIVAPSAMMDGQVAAIRAGLDAGGYDHVPIMAYAAKYASAFYGPFREAAASAPQRGHRAGYQMDPPNVREALREIELDLAQGADLIMIKPALAYLDVIRRARERVDVPLVAYNVSGEYAMIKAAAQRGWIDERRIVMETLTAIKRAGADILISYFALDVNGPPAQGEAGLT